MTMKFSRVADVFEQIEQTSSRLEITQLLAGLFKDLTPNELSIVCHLSLGKLNPPHIGTQFNIASKLLVKIVADMLHMQEVDVTKELKRMGDIGNVLAQYSWHTNKQLSVTEVYRALVALEKISGTGSQDEKGRALQELIHSLSAQEAKYVVRIVLGKLRLGFSDMTLVDALSWMEAGNKSLRSIIENAYNICADIGLIGKTLKQDGIEAVEQMEIHVGVPIRPSAAERLPTAKAIVEKLGTCIAQPKLDGFRLQIHIDNTHATPKIHFYSRNLQDMSAMFPDLLKALSALKVKTLVCEGEAISFDQNTGSFLPFQETVKRKRKHGIEQAAQEFPLKVFIFDLLYLNGTEYLSKTHAERREKLEVLLEHVQDSTVQIIEEKNITDAKQLEDYFLANIASGLEGLVVKRPDARYQPGKRNFNWIKLKRQEEGHLEDTVDCVILGYYAGQGKRARFGIGALLVGVYNKNKDLFQTVAKIGTGLKDAEWQEVKKRCDTIAVEQKPTNVVCDKNLAPDIWVAPELVCMVRADEITMSPVHTAGKTEKALGYALRFPRFMGYRDDKSASDATTDIEIKRLYQDQFV